MEEEINIQVKEQKDFVVTKKKLRANSKPFRAQTVLDHPRDQPDGNKEGIKGLKRNTGRIKGSKKTLKARLRSKKSFHSSQPYLLGLNSQQKVGIYEAVGVNPSKGSLRANKLECGFKITKKRAISRSKKRKRTKSSKKQNFSFLNHYVNEQYKEMKKKESQNALAEVKLYQEAGIPPLPSGSQKQSVTTDKRVSSTASTKYRSKKETIKKTEPESPKMEFNKKLGLFRKVRPITPAAVGRQNKPKLKRVSSAKERKSSEKHETSGSNSHHKLFSKIKISSIQQFATQDCGDVKDYDLSHRIGRGAYAVVRLAHHHPSNEKRAVKLYDRSKLVDGTRKLSLVKEIRILRKVDHPNIIKLHESIDTSTYVYLATEYISGPSLLKYLKSKPDRKMLENEIKLIWTQLIKAVAYLHSKNISHRDIKLENILLTKDCKTVKLIDFGFSTVCSPYKKLKIYCGTPSYMSPQIVQRKEYNGLPADIWACGVLLFTMFCGKFPFKGSSERDLYRRIQRGLYNTPEYVPSQVKGLLTKILSIDPNKRLTADEILEHDWVKN
ncbi:unnamed protein product [Moneuplotes crassus]|uniref:Protein kinase domain-containing protein n=1 Tax=Euplotes crassus TaxID=5936 RepID=A0AAD1UE66_EUPCR|nr:unnamed protein product [Moneuplotes crassus]